MAMKNPSTIKSGSVVQPGNNKGSGTTRVLNKQGQHMPLGPRETQKGK